MTSEIAATGSVSTRSRPRRHVATERWLLVPPVAFLLVLYVYPLVHMISLSAPHGHLTNYSAALQSTLFRDTVVRTVVVSALVSVLCVLLGFPIAYEATRPATKARQLLLGIVLLTFWISLLVRTFTWLLLLSAVGPVNAFLKTLGLINGPYNFQSITGVVIGMTHILLPYMVLAMIPSLRAIDPSIIAAAHSLGANRIRTFSRVIVPLAMGGVLAGTVLTFILGIGFFVTPAVLGSPADMFVAQLIQQQVEVLTNFAAAAAMGVLLTGAIVALLAVAWLLTRSSGNASRRPESR